MAVIKTGIPRREALKLGASVLGAASLAPFINVGRYRLFAGTPQEQEFSERAVRLVREATVIDMLCPLSIVSTRTSQWLRNPSTFSEEEYRFYRASGINVFHDTTGDDAGGADAYTDALQWAAQWNGFLAHHSEWFLRITTPEHLERVNGSNKLGFLLGLQNADFLG